MLKMNNLNYEIFMNHHYTKYQMGFADLKWIYITGNDKREVRTFDSWKNRKILPDFTPCFTHFLFFLPSFILYETRSNNSLGMPISCQIHYDNFYFLRSFV